VSFSYSSDEKGAALTLEALKGVFPSGTHSSRKVSVLDYPGLQSWVQAQELAWGTVDILINNAGVSQVMPIALMDEADWDLVMDTNAKGMYLSTRSVIGGMIRRRAGVVLNVGSLAGVRIIEAPIHYCASKAAAKAFTEALCKEVARYKIRVNCIAPGLLEEGVAENLPDYRLEQFLAQVSLHRRGTLEEVAKAMAFMVSERNSYMNGATVLMEGGL
jgi:NAD(P)-dependent dehydrogenase (short-subunit alcohol dehydrogenase family)